MRIICLKIFCSCLAGRQGRVYKRFVIFAILANEERRFGSISFHSRREFCSTRNAFISFTAAVEEAYNGR